MPFGRKAQFRELANFMRHAGKDPSRLVFEDELTGINNRRFLLRYFDQVRWRTGEDFPISLLAVDLDEFKQVNDRYGHETGDQVLVWFASLLAETGGRDGLPVRYGGDEFAIILIDASEEITERTARRIERSIEAECSIAATAGHASFSGEDTAEAFLAKADRDLYRLKNGKKKHS